MEEVKFGLNRGNVFTSKTVWDHYLELLTTSSADRDQDDTETVRIFRNNIKKNINIFKVRQNSLHR